MRLSWRRLEWSRQSIPGKTYGDMSSHCFCRDVWLAATQCGCSYCWRDCKPNDSSREFSHVNWGSCSLWLVAASSCRVTRFGVRPAGPEYADVRLQCGAAASCPSKPGVATTCACRGVNRFICARFSTAVVGRRCFFVAGRGVAIRAYRDIRCFICTGFIATLVGRRCFFIAGRGIADTRVCRDISRFMCAG